ncbi:MAG: O-antigen ligase family protein [Candidatus Ozemobacteraceae bacterium]
MAKARRNREASPDVERLAPSRILLPGSIDWLDQITYVGILAITLVMPFLFSRMTTENFLTPKEFVSKIGLAFFGWVFFAILGFRFATEGRAYLARTRLDMPLVLFFGMAVVSLLWNYNIPSAIRDLRGTFLILLLFPLIVNTVRQRWQFEGLLWVMVLAGVATSTLGIMESYNIYFRWDVPTGWFVFARDEIFAGQIDYSAWYLPLFPQLADKNYSMMSIVSTFGNRNYLGTFAMFTAFIPLAFYFYYETIVMRAISMGLFTWMLLGLYITRCRAALLGLVVGFAFMTLVVLIYDRSWIFFKKHRNFFIAVIWLFLAGLVFVAATTKSNSMIDKLKTTFTMDRKTSNVYERVWVWYATFQSFATSPRKWLIGSGYGSFKHFFPLQEAETFDDDNKETFTPVTFRQAHNDWLQLVSELGLVGLAIFLWLCWRFFGSIFRVIRAAAYSEESGGIQGDHVLLASLGAAMVSQLVAAIPDFPFHRIETAFYAVVALAMVAVISESAFFSKPLRTICLKNKELVTALFVLASFGGISAMGFEWRCWNADTYVRHAEALLGQRVTPEGVANAKDKLLQAIRLDPLPGDPYLKVANILEMEGKGEEAMVWCERAWQNINFNARSTYHSVVFRMMHIAYHILKDPNKGLQLALKGQTMTAGDARSIFYFYIGKLAMELGDLNKADWALRRCMNFPAFAAQASANLAIVLASSQKWQEALSLAVGVSAQVSDSDPTILDVIGISASNLGQYATAEAALRKAVSLNPAQGVYKRDLGVTLSRMNKIPESRKILEEAIEGGGLATPTKNEIGSLLASVTVFQDQQGMALLKQNKTAEGMAVLKDLLTSKHLEGTMKSRLEKTLNELGAFQAEKGPVPAEAVGNATAVVGPIAPNSPGATQIPASVPSTKTSLEPTPVPSPTAVPVASPAPAGIPGTGAGK